MLQAPAVRPARRWALGRHLPRHRPRPPRGTSEATAGEVLVVTTYVLSELMITVPFVPFATAAAAAAAHAALLLLVPARRLLLYRAGRLRQHAQG
eukprot:COSAG06_NODE_4945_length_3841_cov_3.660075_3_plen_95_part_00